MQVTGRVTFKSNGKTFRSLNGAKIMFGGVERTPITDDQGDTHYSEKNIPGGAEFTIPHGDETDITTLNNLVDVTITAETDTGKTYMGRGAFRTGGLELTANENGEIPMAVVCAPMEEV